jgi:sigma-54 dependent transcriptional regulator, flagellar regulatory protein
MTIVLDKISSSQTANDLIIGESPAIVHLRDMIRRVANSSVSIMISGASGSGKEMVARAIHAESNRAEKPFVALNCGAIPTELIESELFGHERGSFTGANARRIGRFEEADTGTLFLDEIGDMRFDMQVKLLRVLEDGMVTRVGGNTGARVNVRIISATHQDIQTAIETNRFRQDLFFRLGVVPLHVPDLASRREDVPLLIAHFQKGVKLADRARFDAGAEAALKDYHWPGNVRELRNLVERANVLFGGLSIGAGEMVQLLDGKIPAALAPVAIPTDPLSRADDDQIPINLRELLENMELERIQMALDMADGVISEAARLLTLKRTTLIEKMRKYGVDKVA